MNLLQLILRWFTLRPANNQALRVRCSRLRDDVKVNVFHHLFGRGESTWILGLKYEPGEQFHHCSKDKLSKGI